MFHLRLKNQFKRHSSAHHALYITTPTAFYFFRLIHGYEKTFTKKEKKKTVPPTRQTRLSGCCRHDKRRLHVRLCLAEGVVVECRSFLRCLPVNMEDMTDIREGE